MTGYSLNRTDFYEVKIHGRSTEDYEHLGKYISALFTFDKKVPFLQVMQSRNKSITRAAPPFLNITIGSKFYIPESEINTEKGERIDSMGAILSVIAEEVHWYSFSIKESKIEGVGSVYLYVHAGIRNIGKIAKFQSEGFWEGDVDVKNDKYPRLVFENPLKYNKSDVEYKDIIGVFTDYESETIGLVAYANDETDDCSKKPCIWQVGRTSKLKNDLWPGTVFAYRLNHPEHIEKVKLFPF